MTTDRPAVVVVGPTGSGKSDLALKLAKKYNGEIICADSRTIYKGLDVGTAKPSKLDRHAIKHWGIDLVEPNEKYSAFDFKNYATQKIADIKSRGKIAIVVGGTGLYIDALVLDYSFVEPDASLRSKLEELSEPELIEYCKKRNINTLGIKNNRRHLISRIMQYKINPSKAPEPSSDYLVVGITTDPISLKLKLRYRIEQMIRRNVAKEATTIASKYGWDCPGLSGNIYRLIKSYIAGEITQSQLIDLAVNKDYQLARRQITWFKRHKFIRWYSPDTIYSSTCSLIES